MKKINRYAVLYGAFFIYSVSAVCAKMAAQQSLFAKVLLFLGLEAVCLCMYAVFWQQVLKKFTLVTAMSNKGIVVIFNLFWSVFIFKEAVTIHNVAGAIVIICGICIVSSDG